MAFQEELLSTMALIQLPQFAALGGELLWKNSAMGCIKLMGLVWGVVDAVEKEYYCFSSQRCYSCTVSLQSYIFGCIKFPWNWGVDWPQRGISVFDFGGTWDKPKRSNGVRLNLSRLSYDEAEIVQNALYAQNIEVPVKALSGKLYVRPLIAKIETIRTKGHWPDWPHAVEWRVSYFFSIKPTTGFLMFMDYHKIRSCVKGRTPSLFIQDPLGYVKAFLHTSTITLRPGAISF